MSDISFKLAFDFNAKTLSEIIEDENTIKGFYDKDFYDNDKYVTQ